MPYQKRLYRMLAVSGRIDAFNYWMFSLWFWIRVYKNTSMRVYNASRAKPMVPYSAYMFETRSA